MSAWMNSYLPSSVPVATMWHVHGVQESLTSALSVGSLLDMFSLYTRNHLNLSTVQQKIYIEQFLLPYHCF